MIYINDIPSFRDPESCDFIVDDRVEKIELINGNTVQDYGHVETGDTVVLNCIFSKADFESIKTLWINRTKVSFTDESGTVWQNMRLRILSHGYVAKFPEYVNLKFELWRV